MYSTQAPSAERDMDLRNAIQRIALEMPSYGRPRITAELRRRGWVVNAKRIYRMSFFRHREIFRSDVIRSVGERRNRRSPLIVSMSFRLVIPRRVALLHCASASPTGIHSALLARRRQTSFQPTANTALTFCVTSGDNRKNAL
jgi:hypothetical protein